MSQLSEINEEKNELEMTPMIDVTFLLLIFFMCTLKFKTLEGKLAAYLPKDVGVNSSESDPIEKVEILLQVVNEGNKLDVYGEPCKRLFRTVRGNHQFNSRGLQHLSLRVEARPDIVGYQHFSIHGGG